MPKPNRITECPETGLQIATFDFFEGVEYATNKDLETTSKLSKVISGTHFSRRMGEVIVRVSQNDFPEIKRIML